MEAGFGFGAKWFCGDGSRVNGYTSCCERAGCRG